MLSNARQKPSPFSLLPGQNSDDCANVTSAQNEHTLSLSSKQWYIVRFYM